MIRRGPKQLRRERADLLIARIGCYKLDLAKRLAATRKIFGRAPLAVDIHVHSNHSDGRGTVKEDYVAAKRAGLDFLFVTDHSSLGQKRMLRKWADASWGQEPVSRDRTGAHWMHHIGLLCGQRRFRPRCDGTAADFTRAAKIAPFVWIPHPVGWYPSNWYPDTYIEALWTLGDTFAMEVMNGAHKIVRAYDAFDQKAIVVWDRLLCDGRNVTALGGSDAHLPEELGNVWTGVFAARRTAASIIKALNAGHCFASEASLMAFSCNGRPMGSTVSQRKGAKLDLTFRVADSAGIASVRVISRGKTVKEIHSRGRTLVEGTYTRRASAGPAYYRLESTACDDRRAFSTPIYVVPQ